MRPLSRPTFPRLIPAAARALELLLIRAAHGIGPRATRQRRLWQGIEAHDPAQVSQALASGADPGRPLARAGRARHPLGEAIHQRWLGGADGLQVLVLLLAAGADPGTQLVDRAAPSSGIRSEPCLLRALRIGDIASCMALLDYGADPDAVDSWGWSSSRPHLAGAELSARSFALAHEGLPGPHSQPCALFLAELTRRSCVAEASQIGLALERPSASRPKGPGRL